MYCFSLQQDSTADIQINIEGIGTILVQRIDDGCKILVNDYSDIDEPVQSMIISDNHLVKSYAAKLKMFLTSLDADINVSPDFVEHCLDEGFNTLTAVETFLEQNQFDISSLIPLTGKMDDHVKIAGFKNAINQDTQNVFNIGKEQSDILLRAGTDFYLTSGGKVLVNCSNVEGPQMIIVAPDYANIILAAQNSKKAKPLFMQNGQLYFKTLQKEINKYDPTAIIDREFSFEAFMCDMDIDSAIQQWFTENEFDFSTLKPLDVALPKRESLESQKLLKALGQPWIQSTHVARDKLISDTVGYHMTAGGKILSFGSNTLHKPFLFTISDDFASVIIEKHNKKTQCNVIRDIIMKEYNIRP